MKNIASRIRPKRFPIIKPENLILRLRPKDEGTVVEFQVENCSINGIGARLVSSEELTQFLTDEIVFDAELQIRDGDSYSLGRLLTRRIDRHEEGVSIAFSTIDRRIPISSFLAEHIDHDFRWATNETEYELSDSAATLADFIRESFTSRDIFDRCEQFHIFMKHYENSKKYAYFLPRSSKSGPRVRIKSAKAKRKEYLMFGSNDYLGLSHHPEVISACNEANLKYGIGSTGTAPTAGTTDLHLKLCRRIAELHEKDDALVFSSGYGANVGIISGLVREQDLVVADFISHASIQDGIKMSGAKAHLFKHNDMEHLRKVLKRYRKNHAGCLIVTEGVFSMNGTIGKIAEIIDIAREFDARVMIDQGHCFGVLGENFLGTNDDQGVVAETDITMGLFSKAIGTLGGYVTGKQSLIDWLKGYARSLMFATSFPPGIAAATLKAIDIAQTGEFQAKLNENIRYFVDGLVDMGVPIDPLWRTPIIPIQIGDENIMGDLFQSLLGDGVFALPVIYPVVPKSHCRFRFSLTASFNRSDLDYALLSLKEAFRKNDFDIRARGEQVKPEETPVAGNVTSLFGEKSAEPKPPKTGTEG